MSDSRRKSTQARLRRVWAFLKNEGNFRALSAIIVVGGGLWGGFTYVHGGSPSPANNASVIATNGGIAAGRDITGTVNLGLTEDTAHRAITEAQRPIVERLDKLANEAVSTHRSRQPTLEATNRSVINATGAEFPSDMPFPFAKANNDSRIDMPGLKVVKHSDGSMTVQPGHAPRQFPPPTGEFSPLTSAQLRAKLLETAAELRTLHAEHRAGFDEILRKYPSRDASGRPPVELNGAWKKRSERYRPTNEHYARLSQSLASESIARIGPVDTSSMSNLARFGISAALNAKFAGAQPALEAAELLEALSRRLP
jgi:hypothetical protein